MGLGQAKHEIVRPETQCYNDINLYGFEKLNAMHILDLKFLNMYEFLVPQGASKP